MALKSSREGLRKELVDYLGNLIVDDNLRNEIIKVVGNNFVTSESLNEAVNNLTMQITTESGERIETDDTLQNNITAEATAREQTDNTLQDNINAEVTARQEAIANLEGLIGTSGNFYGIDTSNLIATLGGSNYTTDITYTATEDCYVIIRGSEKSTLNGVELGLLNSLVIYLIPMKKDDVICIKQVPSQAYSLALRVFRIKE